MQTLANQRRVNLWVSMPTFRLFIAMAFFILATTNMSWGWVTPPCTPIPFPYLGVNFSLGDDASGGCTLNQNNSWYGVYAFDGATSGATAFYNVTGYNSTHFVLNTQGITLTNSYLALPDTNITMIATTFANSYMCIGQSSTFVCYNGTNGNFLINRTAVGWDLSNSTSSMSIIGGNGTLMMYATGGGMSLVIPYYNSSQSLEINPNKLNLYVFNSSVPAYDYISSTNVSGTMRLARSDFIKNKTTVNATSASTFRATLQLSSVNQIPDITYFPNVDAFAGYYNSSDGTAYLKNNSPAYIYVASAQTWYYVPPLSVANYVDVYNIAITLVNTNNGTAPPSYYGGVGNNIYGQNFTNYTYGSNAFFGGVFCNFTNTTKILRCSVNYSGLPNATSVTLLVTNGSVNNRSIIGTNTSLSAGANASSVVAYTLPTLLQNYSYSFVVNYYSNGSGTTLNYTYPLEVGTIYRFGAQNQFKLDGWFFTAILVLAISLVCSFHPSVMAVGAGFSILLSSVIGFISLSPITFISVMILTLIVAFWVKD